MTFPQTGTYRVVASSISSEVSGAYTLLARQYPGAASPDGCLAPVYDETGTPRADFFTDPAKQE